MSKVTSYGCGKCEKQAPPYLLKNGMESQRILWLRKHYEEVHPRQFKKWVK